DTNMIWGLHRALLANKIKGADVGFVRKLQIIGLGYKAILKGRNIELSLGFSHKINYELPEGVDLSTDKSGQNLTFSSYDKEVLGTVCSQIRSMRPPEPYKGTGVRYDDEIVARKAGKSKA
ncbi:50S ribosomal protein L6, partial [bacterium]|nr:50S ribosomal protein L6 [bacterium]